MAAAAMHDMTTGAVRGHIVRLAAFICFSMLLQVLYSLVDLYWVGRLGPEAIAAVSIGANLMFVGLAGTQALTVGTVALVAHAAGRQDMAAVRFNTAQATSLSLVGGVFFLAAGFAGMRAYAGSVAADAQTAQLTVDYLLWFMPALALQFLLAAQVAALRGLGKMRLALALQTGSLALNFALAPVLVIGWPFGVALGVKGAGLATFLSIAAASVVLAVVLARREGPLRFPLALLRPRLATWRRILWIGLPAGGEFVLMAAYLLLIYGITRPFGPEAQAGFGIGMRWLQAFFMPALSISFAAAAVAGQNFGAGRHDRVRATFREALLQAGLLMFVAMLALQFAPAVLIRLLSAEPAVIDAGAQFLQIISWNLLASAVIFACGGLFQGMGHTLPSLIASAVRIALIMSLALWASGQAGFQLAHVWILSVATTIVQAALCYGFLRREFRLRLAGAGSLPTSQPAAT